MERRGFLSILFAGGVVTGCVGSGNDTTSPAEEPGNDTTPPADDVVNYEELPPDAQEEFVTALEQNGVKECDIALLDVEESIIRYRGEYYTYAVQSGPSSGSESECDKDFLNVEKVEAFS
jgi:hypothetical protein